MIKKLPFFVFILLALPVQAFGEELVYRPVNPNFGGNPLNASGLLANATVQRQHSPPDRSRSTLEEFSASIERSILSRVSREIADQILGEDAKESGRFEVGDTLIDFEQRGDLVVVEITESGKGSTTIEIPSPQF